jgi:hypothetical protein
MHTHIGALVIGTSFIGVLIAGTFWRLLSAHLVNSSSTALQTLGKTFAFQY